MKPNSIVHDSQKSDRSLDRRSELPIGYSVMPTSIATQDFGRRKDRNARIAMFNGGHKNVVKLRRLEQIPGVMINRMNDGQDVYSHPLHGSQGVFKNRRELGEGVNPLPNGVRGYIERSARNARMDHKPEMENKGMYKTGGQIKRDEFVRRDPNRPHTDMETFTGLTSQTPALHMPRNEAWAAEGSNARHNSHIDLRSDKHGTQGGKMTSTNPFEYEERLPNQQSDLPETTSNVKKDTYVARYVRDNSGDIANKAVSRRQAAAITDVPVEFHQNRGTITGRRQTHDQSREVGIRGAGNPTIPATMASLRTNQRVLAKDARKNTSTQENTRIIEDTADVQGQLRFVKATEIRSEYKDVEGMPIGYVPSSEDTVRPGDWDSRAINHATSDMAALPRRDPEMEAVPAGVITSGYLPENESRETVQLPHDMKVTPESSFTLPTTMQPSSPRESQTPFLNIDFRKCRKSNYSRSFGQSIFIYFFIFFKNQKKDRCLNRKLPHLKSGQPDPTRKRKTAAKKNDSVMEELRAQMRDEVREKLMEDLRPVIRSELREELREEVTECLRVEIRDDIVKEERPVLMEALRDEVREQLRSELIGDIETESELLKLQQTQVVEQKHMPTISVSVPSAQSDPTPSSRRKTFSRNSHCR